MLQSTNFFQTVNGQKTPLRFTTNFVHVSPSYTHLLVLLHVYNRSTCTHPQPHDIRCIATIPYFGKGIHPYMHMHCEGVKTIHSTDTTTNYIWPKTYEMKIHGVIPRYKYRHTWPKQILIHGEFISTAFHQESENTGG